MEVEGQVVDLNTGDVLPNASVMVVDGSGKLQGGDLTDDGGNFYLNTPTLDQPGAKVEISYVGYQTQDLTPATVNLVKTVQLQQQQGTLPPVTVTAKALSVWQWYIAGGAAAIVLFLLLYNRKKKKVGKVDPVDVLKWVAILGIPVAAYFLIIKPLLSVKTGIQSNSDQTEKQTTPAADAAYNQQIAAGVPQMLSDSDLTTLATTLANMIDKFTYHPPQYTEAQIVAQVKQVETAADWYRLVSIFGARKFNTGGAFSICSFTALMCDSLDLPSALKLFLSSDSITDLNNYFTNNDFGVQL